MCEGIEGEAYRLFSFDAWQSCLLIVPNLARLILLPQKIKRNPFRASSQEYGMLRVKLNRQNVAWMIAKCRTYFWKDGFKKIYSKNGS